MEKGTNWLKLVIRPLCRIGNRFLGYDRLYAESIVFSSNSVLRVLVVLVGEKGSIFGRLV